MTEFEKLVLEKLSCMGKKLEDIEQAGRKNHTSHTSIETDISRKIDMIGEGNNFLKQKLNNALLMEMRRKNTDLPLLDLKIDVRKMKEQLDIA